MKPTPSGDIAYGAIAVIGWFVLLGILVWSLSAGRISVRSRVYLRRKEPNAYWAVVACLAAFLVGMPIFFLFSK